MNLRVLVQFLSGRVRVSFNVRMGADSPTAKAPVLKAYLAQMLFDSTELLSHTVFLHEVPESALSVLCLAPIHFRCIVPPSKLV